MDKTNQTNIVEQIKDKNGSVIAENTDSYMSNSNEKDNKVRIGGKIGMGRGWEVNGSMDLTGKNKRTTIGLSRRFPFHRTTDKKGN